MKPETDPIQPEAFDFVRPEIGAVIESVGENRRFRHAAHRQDIRIVIVEDRDAVRRKFGDEFAFAPGDIFDRAGPFGVNRSNKSR